MVKKRKGGSSSSRWRSANKSNTRKRRHHSSSPSNLKKKHHYSSRRHSSSSSSGKQRRPSHDRRTEQMSVPSIIRKNKLQQMQQEEKIHTNTPYYKRNFDGDVNTHTKHAKWIIPLNPIDRSVALTAYSIKTKEPISPQNIHAYLFGMQVTSPALSFSFPSNKHPPLRMPGECEFTPLPIEKTFATFEDDNDYGFFACSTELYASYEKREDAIASTVTTHELPVSSKLWHEALKRVVAPGVLTSASDQALDGLPVTDVQNVFAALDQLSHMVCAYRLVPSTRRVPNNGYVLVTLTNDAIKNSKIGIGFVTYQVNRLPSTSRDDETFAKDFSDATRGEFRFWKTPIMVMFDKTKLMQLGGNSEMVKSMMQQKSMPTLRATLNFDWQYFPSPLRTFEVDQRQLGWEHAVVLGSGANGKAIMMSFDRRKPIDTYTGADIVEERRSVTDLAHDSDAFIPEWKDPLLTSDEMIRVVVALKALSANHHKLTIMSYRRECSIGIELTSEPIRSMPRSVPLSSHVSGSSSSGGGNGSITVTGYGLTRSFGWVIKGNHYGIVTEFIAGGNASQLLLRLVDPQQLKVSKDEERKLTKEYELLLSGRSGDQQGYDAQFKQDLERRLKRVSAKIVELEEKLGRGGGGGGSDKYRDPNRPIVTDPWVYLRILVQTAEAVAFMHSFGFLHRDIKPDNVLIEVNHKTGELNAKLADFGFATPMNIWTYIAGSLIYMPPYARAVGKPFMYTDGYADVYALAEMVMGLFRSPSFSYTRHYKSGPHVSLFPALEQIGTKYQDATKHKELTAADLYFELSRLYESRPNK